MEATQCPSHPVPESSGTATNEPASFAETLEPSRFIEFCEACKQYRYIGLCFGAPGIGKTLSAFATVRRCYRSARPMDAPHLSSDPRHSVVHGRC